MASSWLRLLFVVDSKQTNAEMRNAEQVFFLFFIDGTKKQGICKRVCGEEAAADSLPLQLAKVWRTAWAMCVALILKRSSSSWGLPLRGTPLTARQVTTTLGSWATADSTASPRPPEEGRGGGGQERRNNRSATAACGWDEPKHHQCGVSATLSKGDITPPGASAISHR